MGSSGKKHPLSGSCTKLNVVRNFVIAVLWCHPQIFETSYRIVKGFRSISRSEFLLELSVDPPLG